MVVELDEEQVRPLELLEVSGRPFAAQHRVTERRAHALEHRRLPQEAQDLRVEPRQVLGAQVVGDIPVVSGRPARMLSIPEARQRRQPQRRGPALGALEQGGDLVLVELDARSAKQ